MKKRSDFIGIIEAAMGIAIYVIPIVCGFFIITWAGKAYHEGYKLFVEESLDAPGFAHSEMVTISAQDAGSALAVGRILEKQDLISSGLTFAIKARLSGYDDSILPGTFILSSDMTMQQMLEKLSKTPGTESMDQADGTETGNGDTDTGGAGQVKENKDVWGQY